jgi:hypothetical protein
MLISKHGRYAAADAALQLSARCLFEGRNAASFANPASAGAKKKLRPFRADTKKPGRATGLSMW